MNPFSRTGRGLYRIENVKIRSAFYDIQKFAFMMQHVSKTREHNIILLVYFVPTIHFARYYDTKRVLESREEDRKKQRMIRIQGISQDGSPKICSAWYEIHTYAVHNMSSTQNIDK